MRSVPGISVETQTRNLRFEKQRPGAARGIRTPDPVITNYLQPDSKPLRSLCGHRVGIDK
jgi:hypothetical protein